MKSLFCRLTFKKIFVSAQTARSIPISIIISLMMFFCKYDVFLLDTVSSFYFESSRNHRVHIPPCPFRTVYYFSLFFFCVRRFYLLRPMLLITQAPQFAHLPTCSKTFTKTVLHFSYVLIYCCFVFELPPVWDFHFDSCCQSTPIFLSLNPKKLCQCSHSRC